MSNARLAAYLVGCLIVLGTFAARADEPREVARLEAPAPGEQLVVTIKISDGSMVRTVSRSVVGREGMPGETRLVFEGEPAGKSLAVTRRAFLALP